MKKLVAAIVAATFALATGTALAQAKKEEQKKEQTTTQKKEKKGGC
ncbi:MAG: hypothetical protein N2544_17255 [Burkholderiales bacterium]|nr:hypothetical protein [Burkholderiales bacterium]